MHTAGPQELAEISVKTIKSKISSRGNGQLNNAKGVCFRCRMRSNRQGKITIGQPLIMISAFTALRSGPEH